MNPLPYFAVDPRKRSDGRYRIYIRQNTKPATVIPTDFFIKSSADFKKGFPKDVVLKNACQAVIKKLEDIEKKLGGASTLEECWDIMKTKPTKSEFVVDWIIKPNRFQLKEFNAKWKFNELTRDNLSAYLQHLKTKVKDTTIGNHIAELKRVGKSAKRYFDVMSISVKSFVKSNESFFERNTHSHSALGLLLPVFVLTGNYIGQSYKI